MNTIVFLGPSLPRGVAQAILPEARLSPPFRRGDVLAALTVHHADVIVLVDGVYGVQTVWLKEIMEALARGAAVYGGGAMGALRAADLAPCGVVGVGDVFEAYAAPVPLFEADPSGMLVSKDDSEAACRHAGPEDDYRRLTEPLINCIATCRAMETAGALPAEACAALRDAAARLHYGVRTREAVVEAAGLADHAGVLAAWTTHAADPIARDAEACLRRVAADLADRKVVKEQELTASATSRATEIKCPPSGKFYEGMLQRFAPAQREAGSVQPYEVAACAALRDNAFEDRNFAAMNRQLTLFLGEQLGLTPQSLDDETVQAELTRFRFRHRLQDEDALARWLDDNDMTMDRLHGLVRELAVCRRLHRWWNIAKASATRNTRVVCDELRLAGEYPRFADLAAARNATAGESALDVYADHFDDEEGAPDLLEQVREHCRATGLRISAPLEHWAAECGFSMSSLLYELRKEARASQTRDILNDTAAGER